jgi:hypothetical protein
MAAYTVIRLLWVGAKFSTCTVVRVNGTLVEDKMRRFKGECEHFRFNNCPIYTHDGASAKFSTNSQEMDNSVGCHIVIRFVWVSAKFATCTVVNVNGTLVEAKTRTFTLESTHFIFNKFPIYTHDGASAKSSTNSHETDYSATERKGRIDDGPI